MGLLDRRKTFQYTHISVTSAFRYKKTIIHDNDYKNILGCPAVVTIVWSIVKIYTPHLENENFIGVSNTAYHLIKIFFFANACVESN